MEQHNINKNDIIELTIDSYGDNGEGVGRFFGVAVFVPFTIIGERVIAKIILKKKNFVVGKLIDILEKSPHRITPKCDVYTKCGGCQLQHMDDYAQKEYKDRVIKDKIERMAKITTKADNVYFGENRTRYRNKLQLPLTEKDGKLIGGFYAPYSHRIVEIEDCLLQDSTSIKVFKVIKEYANENRVTGYVEETKSGLLRHLVIRKSESGMLITLVINGNTLPYKEKLIEKLNSLHINFGLYININKKDTNVIFGERFIHLFGQESLTYYENNIEYDVTPQSFLQVNDEIKEIMYSRAINCHNFKKDECVINAYSGAGLLTSYFAKRVNKAYGIEIIDEATQSANRLAIKNNIENMVNITGDCGEELPKLINAIRKEKVVLVLDPPRKGVDENVIKAIITSLPKEIIYISCNPSTLSRDIGLLKDYYDVKLIEPYDMFPQTSHVETLAKLSLKENVCDLTE